MNKKSISYFGLAFGLVLWLLLTNPDHLPVAGLIVPFIAIFLLLWILASNALGYFMADITTKKKRIFGGLIAALPTLCLLLQSVGQFSIRDLLTLIVLWGVVWFYLSRTSLA